MPSFLYGELRDEVREGKGWVGMAIREVELGRIGFNFTHRGQLICLLVFLLLNDEQPLAHAMLGPTVRI
jgi:hypothetical protein